MNDREMADALSRALPQPALRDAADFWREARALAALQDAAPAFSAAARSSEPDFWRSVARRARREAARSLWERAARAASAAVAASAAAMFAAASAFALTQPARAAHGVPFGPSGGVAISSGGGPVPDAATAMAAGASAFSVVPAAVRPAVEVLGVAVRSTSSGRVPPP